MNPVTERDEGLTIVLPDQTTCPMFVGRGVKGQCWRCGADLPKYKHKWCSEECALLYARNHSWGFARFEALRRDNWTCQHCGWTEGPSHDQGLEVNHIEARNGMGYGVGCHHHQANLETLCHDCHLVMTKEQRRVRRLIQKGYQQLTLPIV